MTVFIDPGGSARGLREMLYAGNLVVLTCLQAVSDLVEHTRAQLTDLFRPPAGSTSPAVERVASALGERVVLWSVDPADWVEGSRRSRSVTRLVAS